MNDEWNEIAKHAMTTLANPESTQRKVADALAILTKATEQIVRNRASKHTWLDFDECNQLASIAIWDSAPRCNPSLSIAPFLFTVVRHAVMKPVIRNLTKRRDVRRAISIDAPRRDDGQSFAQIVAAPDDVAEEVAQRDHATTHANIIRPLLRQLFSSMEFEVYTRRADGNTYDEIAEQIGTSNRAVNNACQRAEKKIRPILSALKSTDPDDRIIEFEHAVEAAIENRAKQNAKSEMDGINWHAGHKRWQVRQIIDGKRTPLGFFTTIEEAKHARDNPHETLQKRAADRAAKLANPMRWISWNKCTERWQVESSINKKRFNLGRFKSLDDAKKARDEFIAQLAINKNKVDESSASNDKPAQRIKRMKTVNELKIELYDTIENQAVLQAEFNKLEQMKAELSKQLGEARKANADTDELEPDAPEPVTVKRR